MKPCWSIWTSGCRNCMIIHLWCVFFFLTFICIYFLWHLLPDHKLLFLQFILGYPFFWGMGGYLFLLCNLLFWFRNNLFFFSRDHLPGAERAHEQVDLTMSSVIQCHMFGALFTRMCSMTRESKPLSSALLCIFEQVQKNFWAVQHSWGHWPCIQPHCLACAYLPAPAL